MNKCSELYTVNIVKATVNHFCSHCWSNMLQLLTLALNNVNANNYYE